VSQWSETGRRSDQEVRYILSSQQRRKQNERSRAPASVVYLPRPSNHRARKSTGSRSNQSDTGHPVHRVFSKRTTSSASVRVWNTSPHQQFLAPLRSALRHITTRHIFGGDNTRRYHTKLFVSLLDNSNYSTITYVTYYFYN
jgi:hypothetical protein